MPPLVFSDFFYSPRMKTARLLHLRQLDVGERVDRDHTQRPRMIDKAPQRLLPISRCCRFLAVQNVLQGLPMHQSDSFIAVSVSELLQDRAPALLSCFRELRRECGR